MPEGPTHQCLSMIVHTVLALACLDNGGRVVGQCDANPLPWDRLVLAAVCAWYGYELRGLLREGVSMMVAHHGCTILLCLVALGGRMECSGFLTYRATVLAEPIVDAFLLIRGSGHYMEMPISVVFTLAFVATRGVLFATDVVLPVLTGIVPYQPFPLSVVIAAMTVAMQAMQWVWCLRVLSGAARLLGASARRVHCD